MLITYTLNTENTHFKDRILLCVFPENTTLVQYPELGRSLGADSLWFSCERVPLCKISRVTIINSKNGSDSRKRAVTDLGGALLRIVVMKYSPVRKLFPWAALQST